MSKEARSGNSPGSYVSSPFEPRCLIRRVVSLILMVALTSSLLGTGAQGQGSGEYQIKAAFLYNFAKFIEWPAEAFTESCAPLIVGVIGNDPFGSALDQTMSGKTINGRPLIIKRLKWGQNLRTCQILFISSSERKRLAQLFESLKGATVLTVSETEQFCQQGGIINFLIEDNKVRFEINATAATGAQLKISSKLLALAKTVRGRP